jgi:hypothetical protein
MQARRKARPAVLTVVTALFAIPASPAQAQYGGGPPPGGHWRITYQREGRIDIAWTDAGGNPGSGGTTLNLETVPEVRGNASKGAGRSVTISETITATAMLQWVDNYGNPTAVGAPRDVRIKVYSNAGAGAQGDDYPEGTGTATANNGQGDQAVTTDYPHGQSANSSGKHLILRNGSSGYIEVTVTMTAEGRATGRYSSGAQVFYEFNVALDPRGVAVSSDIDPTYRRAIINSPSGQTVERRANVPENDGSMFGDTVAPVHYTLPTPGAMQYVTYFGNPVGPWYDPSRFAWTSNLTGAQYGDWFYMPWQAPWNFVVGYGNAPASPGASDTVRLKLTDGSDGAIAENTYTMKFHAGYEDWYTTYRKDHPDPPTDKYNVPLE